MLSKNTLPYDPTRLTAAHRLERNIEDLGAANLISASRLQSLITDASAAGVKRLNKRKNAPSFKNAARAWKTQKLKNSFWPDVYIFQAPVLDKAGKKTVLEDVAMWLPLDMLAMVWHLGLPEIVLETSNMDEFSKAHLDALKSKLGLPDLMGFGIHGDGVPNNYDRTTSAHVISINLPGVGGKWSRMRIPICVLPSQKIAEGTMDAVLEVVAWSLRHLQAGFHPEARHDGTPWANTDSKRAQKHGGLGFNASLVEVRGDWDWYSKVFHFPYHGEHDGVCWLCPCKRKDVQ